MSGLEDENATLCTELSSMKSTVEQLTDKMDDLENRSRRNNLRVVGLPETILMKDLQRFCELDLPHALGIDRSCRVERAHRIGRNDPARTSSRNDGNLPPRQVIMRFLDYNDKVDIIRSFRRRAEPLMLKGSKVLLFEDFSAEVAGRRRAFSSICSRLYRQKIRFRLLYPATLLVSPEGTSSQTFHTVAEAEQALPLFLRMEPHGDSSSPIPRKKPLQGAKLDGKGMTPRSRSSQAPPKDQRPPRRADRANAT